MFGNENEIENPIPNSLVFALIDKQKENNSLPQIIIDKVDAIFNQRIKFIKLNSIEELLNNKKENKSNNNEKGIINNQWINSINNLKPSFILLFYYMIDNNNLLEKENKIYDDILKIKKYDEYTNIKIFIVQNSLYQYEINNDNNLRRNFNKEDIHVIYNIEKWEIFNMNDFSNNLLERSRNYYKKLKEKYIKRKDNVASDEEKAKYLIKIGIVSLIKSRKNVNLKVKYFLEAYKMIKKSSSNLYSYHYGKAETVKLNYLEIKSNADWIFYKIFQIVKSNNSLEENLNFFNEHLNTFSNYNLYEKNDKLLFFEYYWIYKRIKYFINYYNEINNKNKNENNETLIGNLCLKAIYNLIRVINILKKQIENSNITKITIDNKEILLEKIETEKTKFYGKVPLYQYHIDPLNLKHIGFNETIFIHKFFQNNNISSINLSKELKQNLISETLSHFTKLSSLTSSNIQLYLSILNYINDISSNEEKNILNDLQKIYILLISTRHINKFPKIKLYLLNKFSEFLINKLNTSSLNLIEKKYLFEILVKLGNFKILNEQEENIFFQLFNDNELINSKNLNSSISATLSNNLENPIDADKHKLLINSRRNTHNNLFNFEYSIKDLNKDQTKKMLDLIEYNCKISTCLNKESIKFTSINLIFEIENKQEKKNSIVIKTFSQEQLNELSKENPIIFDYKFLVKLYDKKLFLKQITFTLEKTPFYIYENLLSNSNNNIIFLQKLSKNVLEFIHPNSIKVGTNEYIHFDCLLKKDPSIDLEIKEFFLEFHNIKKNKLKNERPLSPDKNSMSTFLNSVTPNNKNNILNTQISLNIPNVNFIVSEPEIYLFNTENNNLEKIEFGNKISIPNLNDIINNGKKLPIIIKFIDEGEYTISFKANYKIIKKELVDDSFEINEKQLINFQVNEPFKFNYDIICNNFISNQKTKEFPIEKNVKLNVILKNNLEYETIIKEISESLNEEYINNINIESELSYLLNYNKLNNDTYKKIFTVLQSSEYLIPYEIKFLNELKGIIGNINLKWTTEKMIEFKKQYNFLILNEIKIPFPDIIIKKFELELNYKYEIKDDIIDYNIMIKNKINKPKRIVFMVDKITSLNYFMSGINKRIFYLKGNEEIEINLKLIFIEKGNIKLPPFKIVEFNFNSDGTKHEDKLYSYYYYPDYLNIQ